MARPKGSKNTANKKTVTKERAVSADVAPAKRRGRPPKNADQVETKKSTTKVSSSRGRKPAKVTETKTTTKSTGPTFQQRFSSFFSSLRRPGVGNGRFRWRPWYWAVLGGIIIVVLAGYLAATKLVIAWVDHTPITFFQYYGVLNDRYGSQTKEQLIDEQLVLNEAAKRNVSVSQQEIDNQINTIKQQTAGEGDFNQLLAQQGLTMSELQRQVKLQLLIKKMFTSEASVSAQEVDAYIEANKDQYPEASAGAKQEVKDQLEQQKVVDVFRNWLAQQESGSRVTRVQ